MLLWYVALSIVLVHTVFRSRGLDYRLVAAGALLPEILDAPFGRMAVFHSLLFAVVMLAVVMLATVGRPRLLRRRLICLPIGVFAGLLLSGAFLHDTAFLWPALGSDFDAGTLVPPFALVVLMEAAGAAVIGWAIGRFGLREPGRRGAFLHDGRLEELAR
jgi:hypothetical protein